MRHVHRWCPEKRNLLMLLLLRIAQCSAFASSRVPQGCVYKDTYNSALMQAIRNKKDAADTLGMGGLSELVAEIDEAYEAEKKERVAAGVEVEPDIRSDKPAPRADDAVIGSVATMMAVEALKANIDADGSDKIDQYFKNAATMRKTHVKFIAELDSEAALSTAIAQTVAGRVRGTQGAYCLITYDVKDSGEALSNASQRIPPLRSTHLKKMVGAVIRTRNPLELDDGDCFVLFDGGRFGNIAEFEPYTIA